MTKLIIWIYLCVGPECPIVDKQERWYDTYEECQIVLNLWKKSGENNRGVCIREHEQG